MAESNSVVVGAIRLSDKNELRLSFAEYNGRPVLHLRVWSTNEYGTRFPTKNGFPVSPALSAQLSELLAKGEKIATEMGLV